MADSRYFGQKRSEMVEFIADSDRRVLEIGCGQGSFSGQLTAVTERWGIEPDEAAAAQAATRMDRCLRGTFDDCKADLPEHYFDVVICNDVIEHMPDHDAFLEQIKTCLRPGGCLIASLPNLRYSQVLWDLLIHGDFRYRDTGVLDRTHLRFFTAKSLKRTLAEHGYRAERFKPINRLPFRFKLERLTLTLLTLLTLGGCRDAWFRQLAFRARVL